MLLILMSVIFAVTRIMPGDPIRALYGPKISDELYNKLKHELGLDKPLEIQYLDYMSGVIRGDLGISSFSNVPVLIEVLTALPVTLELMIFGTILSVIIGVASGAIASIRAGKPLDISIRILSTVSFSVPVFWFGLL